MTDSIVDRLLNPVCLRALALKGTERVLDVGCGFGEFTRAVSGAADRVVAVDIDEAIVAAARELSAGSQVRDRIDFRAGDARQLPLRADEWGSFDLVHTRFLLESSSEPRAIVEQMVRAAKPGGRVVLVDDDHESLRLWPEAPNVMALWRAYIDWFDSAGNDSIVGRKLVAILHDCGARPIRSLSLSFGVAAGESDFADGVARLRSILETEHAGILSRGRVDRDGFFRGLAELSAWARRPDAAAWGVVRWAEGRVPR